MTDPIPVAASSVLRRPLLGPPMDGFVVGAGLYAAYVRLPGTRPLVAGLLGYGSVPLPVGCLLPDGEPVPPLEPNQPVVVGSGEIRGGDRTWGVARWWTPPRIRPVAPPYQRSVGLLARMRAARRKPLPGAVERALDRTAAEIARGRPDAHALIEVLGTGAGLTPAADDAAAGLLLGLRAFLPPPLRGLEEPLAAGVTDAASRRTTALSAALLDLAGQGRTARPVADAVRALGNPADIDGPFAALLDLGHSSGSDIAAGLLAAAAVASEDSVAITTGSSDGWPASPDAAHRAK